MAGCRTHPAEHSSGTCRSCLGEFCNACLVYSYGVSKAPHCIGCALDAAASSAPGRGRRPPGALSA